MRRRAGTVEIEQAQLWEDAVAEVGVGLPVGHAHLVDEEDDLIAGELIARQVQLRDRDVAVREGVDQLREALVAQRGVYARRRFEPSQEKSSTWMLAKLSGCALTRSSTLSTPSRLCTETRHDITGTHSLSSSALGTK